MENITHSLLGATLAEIALPTGATPRQRTLFYVTGILAANLPDADLVYTRITPPPLGYLLHHRGHTHTIAGVVALAALIGIVVLLPGLRALLRTNERRFAALVLAALGSHLIADSWNSYGVHALWPFSGAWYYGDAVFIAEPWLWGLLGVSVVLNTRGRVARSIIAGALILIPIVASFVGLASMLALIPIALVVAGLVQVMRARPAATRAWTSLVAVIVFVTVSFSLRNAVRRSVMTLDREYAPRRVVDVISNPQPANPLCWNVLSVDESGDSLYIRRGTIGIGVSMLPFHPCGPTRHNSFVPAEAEALGDLRRVMRTNCRVAAWLQFGRVPSMRDGWISDVRFGGMGRGNFTAMQVADDGSAGECPPHRTDWDLPRADVLLHPPNSPPDPR